MGGLGGGPYREGISEVQFEPASPARGGGVIAGARVLIVDEDESVRGDLASTLADNGARCMVAHTPAGAHALLRQEAFSVVLTDINLPGDSGLDFVMQLAEEYPDVAPVMITNRSDPNLASIALEMGAYGYIIKPFQGSQVVIDVANALRRRDLEIENRRHRRRLEGMVEGRTLELSNTICDLERAHEELRSSREDTINRLSIAAELRDDATAQHIQRMSGYCSRIAELAGEPPDHCEHIRLATIMHDVGKIGIPDDILRKPGPLTRAEWDIMRTHTEIGYRILCDSDNDLLDTAARVALTHHERVDGTGYPRGLRGSHIPLVGRIAAIGDVFDALTTERVYSPALPVELAVRVMRAGRGTQFDADLLDLFLTEPTYFCDPGFLLEDVSVSG
jgi:putative two-component system response regulator